MPQFKCKIKFSRLLLAWVLVSVGVLALSELTASVEAQSHSSKTSDVVLAER